MASTEPALKERITRHVLGHSLDVLGLSEKQRERLSRKIDMALKKIEEDFRKGLI
ncbi:MAG: hypothetical protein QXV01_10635 [Candidatus Bathyarchaeia archaeon]|nr:hypothetical protein [Candidatus Bathyarchaeota archaeon]